MNAVNLCMMSIMVLLQHDSMYWNWGAWSCLGMGIIFNCEL